MTSKSYSKTISKERLDRYKMAFSHLNLLKPSGSELSESAGSHFSYKKSKKDKVLASSITSPVTAPPKSDLEHGDPDLSADLQVLTDEFLDQCIHEWAQWLAHQHLRNQTLRLNAHLLPPPIELPLADSHTALRHKEATTDDHGNTI